MKKYIEIIKNRGILVFFKACLGLVLIIILKFFKKKFYIKKIYDYNLRLDLADPGISRGLILFGNRELEHKKMLEMYLKPGMCIYDIGANIGYYVCLQNSILKGKCKIVAIEPSPINFKNLKENIKLNNYENIHFFNAAIGEKNSIEKFYLAEQSNLNSFHNFGTGKKYLSGKTIDVEVKTVSEITKLTNLKPDLIRMDVEGHEVEVINGMIDDILQKKIRPSIIFETHLSRYNKDHDISKPLRKLFDNGYEAKLVGSSGKKGSNLIEEYGHKPIDVINTDGMERKIFKNLDKDIALKMISQQGGIRTILLG